QRQFGIRKVRITMNLYPPSIPIRAAQRLAKAFWNLALRRYYRTSTTDRFTSLEAFVGAAPPANFSCRPIEAMVHPSVPGFEKDAPLMRSDWRARMPFDISLISYNELKNG